ncbi:MAG TPA: LuxR C-terminal-related transcriptional regulator [Bacteroidia bacterium]|nr:LuxR C-terminal-related transcriptional regulator [Bacteroidia bacterium]
MSAPKKKPISLFRQVLLYGLLLGALVTVLKLLEFNLIVKNNIFEVYAGIVALIFTAVGIWVGLSLTAKKKRIVVTSAPVAVEDNEDILKELGISRREYEVLELVAQGLTNQQVADKLFVSLNTVKTHMTNLFAKLEVNRRTQAIQRAKELKILR